MIKLQKQNNNLANEQRLLKTKRNKTIPLLRLLKLINSKEHNLLTLEERCHKMHVLLGCLLRLLHSGDFSLLQESNHCNKCQNVNLGSRNDQPQERFEACVFHEKFQDTKLASLFNPI